MSKRLTILLVLLVVGMLFVPAVALADDSNESSDEEQFEYEPAELVIEQPHYISGDPSQETLDGGLPLYEVEGEDQWINPQNIDSSDVVDYGVAEDEARLGYDSDLGLYQLRVDGEGSYNVYWIVETEVEVEEEVETEDGETEVETTTETEEERYEAVIRVDGGVGLTHLEDSSLDDMRDAESLVQDIENQLSRLGYYDSTEDDLRETMENVINKYHLYTSPFTALTGEYTGIVIMLITSSGGVLVVLTFLGYHTKAVEYLRRKMNRAESVEAVEGEIAEREAELSYKESLQTLANMTPFDFQSDEYVASAFSDEMGERALEAYNKFFAVLQPGLLLHDRLQVMGLNGWKALVETDEDGEIMSAEVVPSDVEPASEQEVDDLQNPDEELIWAIEDTEPICSFSLRDAEISPEQLTTEYPTSVDLDELVAEFDIQSQKLSDEEWGQYLLEFMQTVRQHPDVKPDGTPDTLRLGMAEFLHGAKLLDERHDHPVAQYAVDALQAAIDHHDPVEESVESLNRIQRGESA